MKRRVSHKINIGTVPVGGDASISVQSMTKTDTRDVKQTVSQISELSEAGCDIVRCAVPDMEAAQALKYIKKSSKIPIVADIHFHPQLALEALRSGVDCLRLNPGNIRDRKQVEIIVKEARERQVPIRIGVNFGSLPPVGGIGKTKGLSRHKDGVEKLQKGSPDQVEYSVVDHMVETGLWEISILEDLNFDLIMLDPFSPRKCPQLWSEEFLSLLAKKLSPNGRLTTYCRAAAIRGSLRRAGLQLISLPSLDNNKNQWSTGTMALMKSNTKNSLYDSSQWNPLSPMEEEHLLTTAAIPYRDLTGHDTTEQILKRRQMEQRHSNMESTSAWRKRWEKTQSDLSQ